MVFWYFVSVSAVFDVLARLLESIQLRIQLRPTTSQIMACIGSSFDDQVNIDPRYRPRIVGGPVKSLIRYDSHEQQVTR